MPTRIKSCLVALLLVLSSKGDLFAQQSPAQPPPDIVNPGSGANLVRRGPGLIDFFSSRTPYEFWLTCLIIGFGVVVVTPLLWHMRGIKNRRSEDVSRSVIVVTVIVGSLILVTAGFSNDQIAPAFGLFGTIVGYILGRMSRTDTGETELPGTSAGAVEPPVPGTGPKRTAP